MFRFSCFHSHVVNSHKPKRTMQTSGKAMNKDLPDNRQIHTPKVSSDTQAHIPASECTTQITNSLSVDRSWKSDELKGKFPMESDCSFYQTGRLTKSQSLGTELYLVGQNHSDNITEYEVDRDVNAINMDSVRIGSDNVNHRSIFLIGDTQHSKKGSCRDNDSGDHSPHTPHMVKSRSLPTLGPTSPTSGKNFLFKSLQHQSRSFDDLHILASSRKELHNHEKGHQGAKTNFEVSVTGDHNYFSHEEFGKNIKGESSNQRWDELPSENFKIKLIEKWVNDLQHYSPLEEEANEEYSHSIDPLGVDSVVSNDPNTGKVTAGTEAAKRYISSLGSSATTAQLSNHGLSVIPFLSPFVSLRAINVSANSIVRIAAGALPRGLHMLNLSKNNISTIEGLRELTRLRVLDLSYNRLLRIGHGLASCSSLKELYLAGNKISEVEGLHRLLKLAVLDLRHNKISTAKCLGQLAANYSSLQAISLEGNPAQKNVGDEQLKKTLQSLLPHLVYYNRQPNKVSTAKDTADRSVRLAVTARTADRGLRKASHGHGRKNQAVVSPKKSRGRHGRLPPPPSGTKTGGGVQHHYDFDGKGFNFRSELSMRRSRSEGTIGGAL